MTALLHRFLGLVLALTLYAGSACACVSHIDGVASGDHGKVMDHGLAAMPCHASMIDEADAPDPAMDRQSHAGCQHGEVKGLAPNVVALALVPSASSPSLDSAILTVASPLVLPLAQGVPPDGGRQRLARRGLTPVERKDLSLT